MWLEGILRFISPPCYLGFSKEVTGAIGFDLFFLDLLDCYLSEWERKLRGFVATCGFLGFHQAYGAFVFCFFWNLWVQKNSKH